MCFFEDKWQEKKKRKMLGQIKCHIFLIEHVNSLAQKKKKKKKLYLKFLGILRLL